MYYFFMMQEFSPGSNGRMTTMGVYVRDLILGQVCILSSSSFISVFFAYHFFISISCKLIAPCQDSYVQKLVP
jgi:hypothetical protein